MADNGDGISSRVIIPKETSPSAVAPCAKGSVVSPRLPCTLVTHCITCKNKYKILCTADYSNACRYLDKERPDELNHSVFNYEKS